MTHYFVEGLYLTAKAVKKSKKGGKITQADIEPFSKTYWAETPEAALRLATEDLHGGEWRGQPKVSQTTEEERMRQQGQPELPGLFGKKRKG